MVRRALHSLSARAWIVHGPRTVADELPARLCRVGGDRRDRLSASVPICLTGEVTRMKVVLFARSRSSRGAQRPVLYGLLALVSIGASTAAARPRAGLVQKLDSIAG